jgi:hypothetical protein
VKDYVVEVDVVMPGDTLLWKAHDIAQLLQDKLETLPRVERAYVHVDHETTHVPVSLLPLSARVIVTDEGVGASEEAGIMPNTNGRACGSFMTRRDLVYLLLINQWPREGLLLSS